MVLVTGVALAACGDSRIGALEAEVAKLRQERTEPAATPSPTPTPNPPFHVGSWGHYFSWSLRVDSAQRTATVSGGHSASGVYVRIEMSVINNSSGPAEFPYRQLRLQDRAGRAFSWDGSATISVTVRDYDGGIYDDLQPGITYTTGIVFDVAPAYAAGFVMSFAGSSEPSFYLGL